MAEYSNFLSQPPHKLLIIKPALSYSANDVVHPFSLAPLWRICPLNIHARKFANRSLSSIMEGMRWKTRRYLLVASFKLYFTLSSGYPPPKPRHIYMCLSTRRPQKNKTHFRCLGLSSFRFPLPCLGITLAPTLRNRTFNMTLKPSQRVVHMHDMLTLETESREVRHSMNLFIDGHLRAIGARDANDLHTHRASRKMSTALRAAKTCIDTCS